MSCRNRDTLSRRVLLRCRVQKYLSDNTAATEAAEQRAQAAAAEVAGLQAQLADAKTASTATTTRLQAAESDVSKLQAEVRCDGLT